MPDPFKLLRPDTLGCKFHLIDNDLRQEAASYDLISALHCLDEEEAGDEAARQRAQRGAVFTLLELLPRFERAQERVADVGDPLSKAFKELMTALERQKGKLRGLAKQALVDGALPWELLPHAFCKDDEAVVSTDDSCHGARILSVKARESLFGAFMVITFRFLAFDGTRFRWATATKNVGAYDGVRRADQLGISPMAPERAAELDARGKRFTEICSAPSFIRYEGSLTRRGWRGDKRLRAGGRAMADGRAMREMDPDYSEYYGEFDDDDEGARIEGKDLDAAHFRLASPYVYGFSFLCKAWGELLVSGMSSISFRKDAFDKLVLDPSRKRLVEALVRQSTASGVSDLIDGKGGGCIFLLHGPPGVGKTLTAEAIAERLERPLYMVGAGELGITPNQLEERLKAILDTAHAWNAVLLIDEADIFLERRSGGDVARNAMVGIFLRLLEYHQGILFLTTNRVTDIDEAFLSRVPMGLHYSELSEDDRSSVWRNLIDNSAAFPVGGVDCQRLGRMGINGRQIKHCVRLAVALAHSEKREPTEADLADMARLALEFRKDFSVAHDERARAET